MRKSWLKRKTPLKAKSSLWDKIRAALPKRNKKRAAKRAAEDVVYGSFYRWVRDNHGCAIAGEHECYGPIDGHHLRSVGAGGMDAANVVPLCRSAHTLWHTIGARAFDERFFGSLPLYAQELWGEYQRSFSED